MADAFSLTGSYTTTPNVGSPSLIANIQAPINQQYQLGEKQLISGLNITSDEQVDVAFGSLGSEGANVLVIQSPNGKLTAAVTSTDGSAQLLPVDPTLILISLSVPITALSLTRVAGQDTPGIDIFLGQLA